MKYSAKSILAARKKANQPSVSTAESPDLTRKISYSQSGEDIIVDFLFSAMLNINEVSYLDIGANDPIDLNNTYFFYKKGFTGVCVDPNPFFKDAYKLSRPGDTHVLAGVGPKKGNLKFFEVNPHTLSTFSEESARQFVEEDGHEIVRTYKVPVMTLDQIINRYFKESALPNFLNLDVEGWDYEIIKSAKFKNWRPTVVCIETVTYSTKKEQEKIVPLFKLLEDHGYFAYADTFINTIFVDKDVWEKRRQR